MKKNIREYKEIVEIVAGLQEILERRIKDIEENIKYYKDKEDYEENEYYQVTLKRYVNKEVAINKVIDNLDKLL